MRDTRRLRTGYSAFLTLCLATALGGCTTKHGDMVIFATSTKVAFDVSAEPTDVGTPSITLGYKRQEGVLMPLVVNGRDSILLAGDKICDPKDTKREHCTTLPPTLLTAYRECAQVRQAEACLQMLSTDLKYVGVDDKRRDTYSVFASFGGDFSGGKDGAKAGLAQFFATGIAAQNLSERPEVAKALKAEDTASQVVTAQQETIAAKDELIDAQRSSRMQSLLDQRVIVRELAIQCWKDHRDDFRQNATGLTGSTMTSSIVGDNEDSLRASINKYPADRKRLQEISEKTCPKN